MTRERRKYYAPLLQLFVILIWCVSAAHAHHGGGYHYSHSACANNPDWMAGLANNLRISDLSIPGTHDTYSIVEHSWAAHCQMMGLTAQLTSGIRVLDVRLNVEGNRLRTAHGSYEFSSYFEHVLAGCTEFLGAHDQETILMRVQRNSGDVALFAELFEDYIHAPYEDTTYFGRWFWNPVTSTNPHNPTLGEVRGKIVLLQNFSVYPDTLYGLQYGDASMDIQDSFKMSTNWSLSQWKAQAVVDHPLSANIPETATL